MIGSIGYGTSEKKLSFCRHCWTHQEKSLGILDSELNHPPLKKEGEIIEGNFLIHNTFFPQNSYIRNDTWHQSISVIHNRLEPYYHW